MLIDTFHVIKTRRVALVVVQKRVVAMRRTLSRHADHSADFEYRLPPIPALMARPTDAQCSSIRVFVERL